MKALSLLTLSLLQLAVFPAYADRTAYTEEWSDYANEAVTTPKATAPIAQVTPAGRPEYPPEVADTLKKLGISLDPAPAGAPQPEVSVDKETQEITINSPSLDEPWIRKVSTGGGLKIPNGENYQKPYCASTPNYPRHFIPATTKGGNAQMEPVHYSKTFTHDGVGSEMKWSIRMVPDQGVFFHEVPGGTMSFDTTNDGYRKVYNTHLLGHNVSGECIRLDGQTARLLYGLSLKYGGIYAQVVGNDPAPVTEGYCDIVNGKKKCFSPNYCDEDMRLAAERGSKQAAEKVAKNGGGFGGWLTSIFGEPSPNGTSGSSTSGSGRKHKRCGDGPVGDIIACQMGTAFSN